MNRLSGSISYLAFGEPHSIEISGLGSHDGPHLSVVCEFARAEPGRGGLEVVVRLLPEATITLTEARLEWPVEIKQDDRLMVNGFQTWTESREYAPHESIQPLHPLARFLLSPFGDYGFSRYSGRPGILHSWTYTYRRRGDQLALYGSRSEGIGYTCFVWNTSAGTLTSMKDVEGLKVESDTDLIRVVVLYGEEHEVFDEYFRGTPGTGAPHVTGWTSWYKYYNRVTEKDVLDNLDSFRDARIPIDVFQIDDGYQQAVGDWLSINGKFPSGMKNLADRIREAGYTPGLWIAPFVCERKSRVFREQKDWLVRDSKGRPVRAGFNPLWSGPFYALDIYNDGFRAYLEEVFHTVLDGWGFDLVKLDFLYAAGIVPRLGKSRGMIMREALELTRNLCAGRRVLGCGVPLGPAFGLVDYCRIGSDVALSWEDRFLRYLRYRERVSAVNSLSSTIGRHALNGRAFLNDPDVFILRSRGNSLTFEQRKTLHMANLLFGGLVFSSDSLSDYSPDEMALYLRSFPHREKEVRAVKTPAPGQYMVEFSCCDREYLAFTNLSCKTMSILLPSGLFFWEGKGFVEGNREVRLGPYQSACLLKVEDSHLAIAGSSGHVFPGCEVEAVTERDGEIRVEYSPKARAAREVHVVVERDAKYVHRGRVLEPFTVGGVRIVTVSAQDGDRQDEKGKGGR